jgi:hypothetical protein
VWKATSGDYLGGASPDLAGSVKAQASRDEAQTLRRAPVLSSSTPTWLARVAGVERQDHRRSRRAEGGEPLAEP